MKDTNLVIIHLIPYPALEVSNIDTTQNMPDTDESDPNEQTYGITLG